MICHDMPENATWTGFHNDLKDPCYCFPSAFIHTQFLYKKQTNKKEQCSQPFSLNTFMHVFNHTSIARSSNNNNNSQSINNNNSQSILNNNNNYQSIDKSKSKSNNIKMKLRTTLQTINLWMTSIQLRIQLHIERLPSMTKISLVF